MILACRDEQRGSDAAQRIMRESGSKKVDAELLDLASLWSVKEFCQRMHAQLDRLDILVNNAGMCSKTLAKTVDGFETTFQTNHLGR